MNEHEINQLFLNLPFRDAKDRIVDHLKKCGTNLTGNESIWELKSLAIKTFSGSQGVVQDFAPGGSNVNVDNDTLGNSGDSVGGANNNNIEPQQIDEPTPSKEPNTHSNPQPNNEPEPESSIPENDSDKNDDTVDNVEQNTDDTNNHRNRRKCRNKEESTKDKLERIDSDKKKKEEQLKKLQDEMEKLKEEEERIKEEERKRKEQEEEEKRKQQQAQSNKKHKNEDEIVRRLKCLKKAFLVGPAGTGKSTLAMKACAEIFNIEGGLDGVVKSDKFAQISFSPDTVSADMIGFQDVNGVFHETDIIRVFRDGGLILFDEMDDADASLLVKLNTMLANGVIPTPNGVIVQNENTYIVGTANTFGKCANAMYVGRNRLDAATLDRWKLATIFVDYDTDLEDSLIDMQIDDKKKVAEISIARNTIRRIIDDNKYKQICSTRFVIDAIKLSNSGYPINKIVDIFLLDWDDHVAVNVKSSIRDNMKNLKNTDMIHPDKQIISFGQKTFSYDYVDAY